MEEQKQIETVLVNKDTTYPESSNELPPEKPGKGSKKKKSTWETLLYAAFIVLSLGIAGWATWKIFGLLVAMNLPSTVAPGAFMIILALALIKFMGFGRGLAYFLIIGVVCTGIWAWVWFSESPEYRAGINAFDNEDFATAVKNLDIVIKNNPDHDEAYVKRCIALRRIGRSADALPDCNKAIKLGYIYEDESYRARAFVYEALGRPKEAVQDYTTALRARLNPYDLFNRGRMHRQLKQYDLAVRDFRKVLSLDKHFASAHWGLGNALYDQGNKKDALAAYEKYEKSGEKITKGLRARIDALHEEMWDQ